MIRGGFWTARERGEEESCMEKNLRKRELSVDNINNEKSLESKFSGMSLGLLFTLPFLFFFMFHYSVVIWE